MARTGKPPAQRQWDDEMRVLAEEKAAKAENARVAKAAKAKAAKAAKAAKEGGAKKSRRGRKPGHTQGFMRFKRATILEHKASGSPMPSDELLMIQYKS